MAFCVKKAVWPVLDANWDLMISHQQVEGYEAMRVVKVLKNLVDRRQGVLVLLSLLINLPIVHSHPEPAKLIGNYFEWACVGAYSWNCIRDENEGKYTVEL